MQKVTLASEHLTTSISLVFSIQVISDMMIFIADYSITSLSKEIYVADLQQICSRNI